MRSERLVHDREEVRSRNVVIIEKPDGLDVRSTAQGCSTHVPRIARGTGVLRKHHHIAVQAMFGDDDTVFREILNDFTGPARDMADEITKAFDRKDPAEVGAAAHKLKSAARSIGAHALADIAEALEAAGKAGDWGAVEVSMAGFDAAVDAVSNYIDTL